MKRWPVDKVALRVVLPGIHYNAKRLTTLTAELGGQAEAPPRVNMPHDQTDLAGMQIGQLVVVRYLGDRIHRDAKRTGSRWLVRCLCGRYENRRGRTLRKAIGSDAIWADRCEECQNLRKLRGESEPSCWGRQPIQIAPLLPGSNDIFAGGERFGRLTVIGYGKSGGGGAKWVVRCDCGAYGMISARAIKGSKSQCDDCDKAAWLGAQP